jgi:hypothetical protein
LGFGVLRHEAWRVLLKDSNRHDIARGREHKLAMSSQPVVSSLTPWSLLLPPVGVTAFLWVTRVSEVTPEAVLYAFFLLLIPWCSFLIWRQRRRRGIPVFALVALAYWWFFAIGLFWLDRELRLGRGVVAVEEVTGAVWLALVGVVCIGAGMKVHIPQLTPERQLELDDHPTSWIYVRWILVLGTLGSLIPGFYNLLGADGRHIMQILISTVPTVALMLLLRRCLEEKESRLDRALLWGYFPVRIVIGLASGWLGSAVSLGLVCGAMYLFVRRKVPWTLIAISVITVLFLEVGKNDFRAQYWNGEANGGLAEKATSWVNGSASKWSDALQEGGGNSSRDLSNESLERTSLLPQVAHVLELTPSQVPFQMGQTYSYLAITLIPRFMWPDKPSVNDANHYYQVAFGLTGERDLNNVNIGIGCLTEAYINFGWPGVAGIMLAIGVLLSIYERTFVSSTSSKLFFAIGLALLPGVLGIESQMSAYLGGVIQHIALTIIVFLPVVRRGAHGVRAGQSRPGPAPVTGQLRVRPS